MDPRSILHQVDKHHSLLFLAASTLLLIGLGLAVVRRRTANPTVISVSLSRSHSFTKQPQQSINLLAGLGIEHDAHQGVYVQHLSRIKEHNPDKNLRQVHLIHNEILQDYGLKPADIGENITTSGIDLLALGQGTKLRFVREGSEKVDDALRNAPCIIITGLRNPCYQIDKFRKGLQEKFIERDEARKIRVRKAGIMSIVEKGGKIIPGMSIVVEAPKKLVPLDVV